MLKFPILLVMACPFAARAQAVASIPVRVIQLAGIIKESTAPVIHADNHSPLYESNTLGQANQRRGIVCAPIVSRNRSNPLIILDGRTISDRKLQYMKPEDIENIIVIKGEQAISEYGSSGENGVLVITMKRKDIGKKKGRLN